MTSFSVRRQKCDSFLAHFICIYHFFVSAQCFDFCRMLLIRFLQESYSVLQCRVASEKKYKRSDFFFYFSSSNCTSSLVGRQAIAIWPVEKPRLVLVQHRSINTATRGHWITREHHASQGDKRKFFVTEKKIECWMQCARGMHVNFYFINVKSHQKCYGLDFISLPSYSIHSNLLRPFNLTFAN